MSVPVSAPLSHQELAHAASEALLAAGAATSTCILGSAARRDPRPDSDVDLLLITPRRAYVSELTALLPGLLRDARLSLIPRTPDGWSDAVARGSLFVLHVRLEGTVLHDPDGWLENSLVRAAAVPPDVEGELARQRRRLRVLRDVERFNGRYVFLLSDLFSIGKACAIAHCVAADEPIFVKQRALRRAGELRPELRSSVEVVSALQPFYDFVRGRAACAPDDGDRALVGEALTAVEALAGG